MSQTPTTAAASPVTPDFALSPATAERADYVFAAGLFILAATVAALCTLYPSRLPAFMPWEFSWPMFLGTGFSLWWFFRGRARLAEAQKPSGFRTGCFVLGAGSIYFVLQTHYLYLAEHMFFLNRIQHVVMHHLGPFLLALAAPWEAMRAGMPAKLSRLCNAPPVKKTLDILQRPFLAAVLFVGLIALWLYPPVHFKAMLNPFLFSAMNWSMVLDGILFWWLVLDPRPNPPARVSFNARNLLAMGVMFPQIVMGAIIALASHDIYPYYAFCGRIYPGMSALQDQMVGGIVVWIPPAMMSVVALITSLNYARIQENKKDNSNDEMAQRIAKMSREWTG
ncbi:MAG: cytochrome c oxidase assembly protein [Alphaproteobacteria bacterium]|nr:cytochrome c oxidase assembly protein [Alphaproteobacteria bacterium]